MIELNCSYEESKKILELGYDFGKKFGDMYQKKGCSDKYILVEYYKIKAQEHIQITEKYFDTDVEKFTLERQSSDYEDSLYNSKHYEYFELGEMFCNPNSEGFVPIIPKAALEACLPELSNCIWSRNITIGWIVQDLDPHLRKFRSIFKAFTWCHENYPEELKAKFDEVMA